MGNKQNTFTFCCKVLYDHHKLIDLLGSKYRCRLIKDQDLIITIQHFQDFRSLLHTNCDIFDLRIRVNRKTIFFRQLHNLFSYFILFQKAAFCCGFHTQHDIIQNRKTFYQLKMLVNHTNSKFIGIIGVLDIYFLTIFSDLAFLWLI